MFVKRYKILFLILTVIFVLWLVIPKITWYFALGLGLLAIATSFYYRTPVRTDRWLYGKKAIRMIGLFSISIVTIFLVFSGIVSFLSDSDFSTQVLSKDTNPSTRVWWALLTQFSDPGNLPLSKDTGGRIVAFVSAILGMVLLSGFFVSSIVNALSRRAHNWKNGLIIYKRRLFENYVVIIGINEQAASIVRRSLKRQNVDYVLILTKQNVERARLELESKIDDSDESRIVFYAGDRTSYEDIEKLHLEKAKEVYILGEIIDDVLEKDHDSFNISCLEHISNYYKDRKEDKRRLKVHVQFDYQSTFTAFKATHLYLKLSRNIEFIPFNIHEIWAKKVFVDNFAMYPVGNKAEMKVQRYFPLDNTGEHNDCFTGITADCNKTVHLLILGMNQMGTALATQAALLCHFPNFAKNKKKTTTITFIDDNAIKEANYYMGRYSTLFELSKYTIKKDTGKQLDEVFTYIPNFKEENKGLNHLVAEIGRENCKKEYEDCLLDVDWEFIQGNSASKPIQDYIKTIAENNTDELLTVAICFNDSQQSLASALYLPKIVYDKCNQVLVYQRSIFDLVNDVTNGDSYWKKYNNLFPFGMSENTYIENPYDSFIAKLDYFIYQNPDNLNLLKECCQNCDKPDKSDTIGLLDNVDKVWEQVGIVRKIASIDSADSIQTRLRSIGTVSRKRLIAIGTKNKNNDPLADDEVKEFIIESEHMRWMMQRLIAGYRHYSDIEQRDAKKSTTQRDGFINAKKDEERAHIDICSFKKQKEIDFQHYEDDRNVILYTPYLIFGSELLSVLRLCNTRYKESQHYHWLKKFFRNDGKYNSFIFIKGDLNPDKKHCSHSFWMSDTTVTVKQWYDTMGIQIPPKEKRYKNYPKVNVSKDEIDDFLAILRNRSGLHFELPSLKEWYTAADKYKSDDKPVVKVKKRKSAGVRRMKNDSKVLHHILGNVWEWTHTQDDHSGFVFCGGSYRFKDKECELGNKYEYYKKSWDGKSKSVDLGFRLIWPFDKDIDCIKNGADGNNEKGNNGKPDEDKIINWFKLHKMVQVKAGFYIMGSDNTTDPDTPIEEKPRHAVKISKTFYICSVPVTQSLWNAVNEYTDMRKNPTKNQYGDEFPQTDVSWKTVNNEFLVKLNNVLNSGEKLKKYLEGKGINTEGLEFRLPTEAEWEYAAKGGTDDRIHEGGFIHPLDYTNKTIEQVVEVDDINEIYKKYKIDYFIFAGSCQAEDVAWFNQPSIREVAKKEPNKCGLYDMSGNVWEWCYDNYIAEMYPACKIGDGKTMIQEKVVKDQYINNGYIIDPVALDNKYSAHVLRGGSWRCPTEYDCRCTRANFWVEEHQSNDIGFRLVLGQPILTEKKKL